MKHYKNPSTNELFAYDDDVQEDQIQKGLVQVSEADVKNILAQKNKDKEDALSYAVKRQREYPSITEYIDGVVKGDQKQIDAYIAQCIAVKAKYPKPE